MLHASSRHSLLRGLGSTVFTDAIFATSKDDITPHAYARHKEASTAPQPMSSQEQALADIKAAERDPGSGYDGSSLKTHFPGSVIGFDWPPELMEVVKDLAAASTSQVLVIVGRPFTKTH
jgi:twinfilin-like protein